QKVGVARLARTGDVESGAVVHRGADDGQPDGDVHAGIEADHLDRDVPLVVVGRDHRVELAGRCPDVDRVRRPGAGSLDSTLAGLLHGRPQPVAVLAPEQAVFPGMWVQAGYRHARPD